MRSPYIFEEDDADEDGAGPNDSEVHNNDRNDVYGNDEDDYEIDDAFIDEVYKGHLSGEIDLDSIMVSAASAGRPRGSVDPEHLAKIWRISHEDAKRTIDATSQHCVRTHDPKLSRNYGTNDRMLRYKRINDYFFMDTFFATKKRGKSMQGNTCCQLFVTDKGLPT